MSAALDFSLRLLPRQDELPQCRFCHCAEFAPCTIAIAQDLDGTMRLARSEEEVLDVMPCRWYIDGCCNAPRCIMKLLAEWGGADTRAEVLLFDFAGRKLTLAEDRALDSDADDRDFSMIGNALGLERDQITREAILERIRELREAQAKRRRA